MAAVAKILTSRNESIFFNIEDMRLNYGEDDAKKVICVLSMGYGFKFKALMAADDNTNNCFTFESDGEIVEIN